MSRNEYDSVSGTLIPIGGWQSVDQSLSGTSNNPLANHVINAELQKANGATTSQTLTTGSTSVTFDVPTTGDNLIEFYTSTGINYTAIDTSTAGEVTISFDEQEEDVTVYCNITASRAIIGLGNRLEVTCDYEFAGADVTCTNGTKTFTRVCPTTEPYVVEFEGLDVGTWTVSATANNKTKFATVTITDSSTELVYGFNWKNWVDLSKNYSSADFEDLEDVFANEEAVRELMTVHASADYLIEAVDEDIAGIDAFCANDTAMKWIGLRDYVCDGLTAIDGVWTKFLASDYWERILKDHVPTMKSNTTPYGTAGASSQSSTAANKAWAIFDGNDSTYASKSAQGTGNARIYYKFTNPIKVRKFYYLLNNVTNRPFKIQYSDDGTTWNDAYNGTIISADRIEDDINDVGYHLYWGVYVMNSTNWSNYGITLQFYGRSLNVSVPVMTSNTAPYGEAFASTEYNSSYKAYNSFDGVLNQQWLPASNAENNYIGYDFGHEVCVRNITIDVSGEGSGYTTKNMSYIIQGSNSKTSAYVDIQGGEILSIAKSTHKIESINLNSHPKYRYYRVYIPQIVYIVSSYFFRLNINFYGVDYSEREFAEGSTMKYLYDHGVELETIQTVTTDTSCIVTKNEDNIYLELPAQTQKNAIAYAEVDLSNYSLFRGITGDNLYSSSTSAPRGGGGIAVYPINDFTWANAEGYVSSADLVDPYTWWAIDISSFNEIKAIGVYSVNTSPAYVRKNSCKELWLE